MNALPCACGHPYAAHFAGGPCIAGHQGEASVCPCLAWRTVGDGATPDPPVRITATPRQTREPAPKQAGPSSWHDTALSCTGCDRTTYRPPSAHTTCDWCGGTLTATRELHLAVA